MENGCDHQLCGPAALWKVVQRRACDPASEKAGNAITEWAAHVPPGCCVFSDHRGELQLWEHLLARAHGLLMAMRGEGGGQEDRCLVCSSSPALNALWILGSPLSAPLLVQENSADSAISTPALSGLRLDGWGRRWWEDKHLHGGLRGSVYRSGSLAGSPAFWSSLLTSTAPLMAAAEAEPARLINWPCKPWQSAISKQTGEPV